jgi:hypothetical protein
MSTSGTKSEIVLALAEQFLERYRQGERLGSTCLARRKPLRGINNSGQIVGWYDDDIERPAKRPR